MLPVHHLPPTAPNSWTGPLRQEIPLHLQLADLLVEAGDQGGVVPGFLVLAVAEDAGGALHKGFLPSLNLAGVDLVPGRQLGLRLLALDRFQRHPGFEGRAAFLRPWEIPQSSLAATAAFSLRAGLSFGDLSDFPALPQIW